MRMERWHLAVGCWILILLGTSCRAEYEPTPERALRASVVQMTPPEDMESLRRPVVEFEHGQHEAALQADGCEACHGQRDEGGLDFLFVSPDGIETPDELMEQFHAACDDCHAARRAEGRNTGPEISVCARCHVQREPGLPTEVAPRFDQSLHHRHVLAGDEKCETCHHVLDEETDKLVYKKGEEAACRVCHGDGGQTPKLRDVAHATCVNCHLASDEDAPTSCERCHVEENLAAIDTLDEVPRLMRGQPDQTWIHFDGGTAAQVAFDHQAHEAVGGACSTCHHENMEACDSCHDRTGLPDGGGVTLEHAYHAARSDHSCVGCHEENTERKECAGCHAAFDGSTGERSCTLCHVGRPPHGEAPEGMLQGTQDPVDIAQVATAEFPVRVELAPLAPTSDDFPDTITIDLLADEFQAAEFPHRQIVARLDEIARQDPLAVRFHGDSRTVCAGCHHNSPTEERPSSCNACHDGQDQLDRDRPSLKHAYHRQCMDCHQQMDIGHLDCEACHAKASRPEASQEDSE